MNAVMETQSTRAQHKEQFRKQILSGAREMFVQEGYERFSMRKLASKIGCSAGGLYLYFENKEELFQTLVEETFQRLTTLLTGLCSRNEGKDPIELLKKALYTYVDFGLRNANDYRFTFLLSQPTEQECAKIPPPVAVLGKIVERCSEEGRLRDVHPEVVTQALWASVHGITSLFIQRPSYPWAEKAKVAEHLIANAVAGLVLVRDTQEMPVMAAQAAVA